MGSATLSQQANDFTVDFHRRIGARLGSVYATDQARLRSVGVPVVSVA